MKIPAQYNGFEDKAIARAWNEMLAEADERLCQLLVQKVKSTTGREPQMHEVRKFVRALQTDAKPAAKVDHASTSILVTPLVNEKAASSYSIDGAVRLVDRSAAKVTREAINALADFIPTFMDVFDQKHQDHLNRDKKRASRRWIGRDPRDLHDNRRVRHNFAREFRPGWWINVNLDNNLNTELLTIAQGVAEEFGVQLEFEMPPAKR